MAQLYDNTERSAYTIFKVEGHITDDIFQYHTHSSSHQGTPTFQDILQNNGGSMGDKSITLSGLSHFIFFARYNIDNLFCKTPYYYEFFMDEYYLVVHDNLYTNFYHTAHADWFDYWDVFPDLKSKYMCSHSTVPWLHKFNVQNLNVYNQSLSGCTQCFTPTQINQAYEFYSSQLHNFRPQMGSFLNRNVPIVKNKKSQPDSIKDDHIKKKIKIKKMLGIHERRSEKYQVVPQGISDFIKSSTQASSTVDAAAAAFSDKVDALDVDAINGVFSSINSADIPSVVNALQELMSFTKVSVQDLDVSSINDTFIQLKDILGSMQKPDSIKNQVVEVIKDIDNKFKVSRNVNTTLDVAAVIAVISTAIYAYNDRSVISIGSFALASAFLIYRIGRRSMDIIIGMYGYIKTSCLSNEHDVVEPHISGSDISSLATLVSTALSSVIVSESPKGSMIKSVSKELGNFGRVKQSLTDITNMIIKCLEVLVNAFRNHILGVSSLSFVSTSSAAFNEYTKVCLEFETAVEKGDVHPTLENIALVRSLIERGNEILKVMPRNSDTSGILMNLSNHLNSLSKVKEKLLASNIEFQGVRQEPVGLLLMGGPGVAKSQALLHIKAAVCARILDDPNRERYRQYPNMYEFNRQSENAYWDGYANQLVTMFDDFGQNVDVAGNPDNEYMNIIRAINCFPYHLHMADIAKKSNYTFQSKFVFATTNLPELRPSTLVSAAALGRRFNLTYMVFPKPEFEMDSTKGKTIFEKKLDCNKLPIGSEGVSSLQPDALLFRPTNPTPECSSDKGYLGPDLSFEQLVDALVSQYKLKCSWFEQQKTELDQRFEHHVSLATNRFVQMVEVGTKPEMDIHDIRARLKKPIDDRTILKGNSSIINNRYNRLIKLGKVTKFTSNYDWFLNSMAILEEEYITYMCPHPADSLSKILEMNPQFEEYYISDKCKLLDLETQEAIVTCIENDLFGCWYTENLKPIRFYTKALITCRNALDKLMIAALEKFGFCYDLYNENFYAKLSFWAVSGAAVLGTLSAILFPLGKYIYSLIWPNVEPASLSAKGKVKQGRNKLSNKQKLARTLSKSATPEMAIVADPSCHTILNTIRSNNCYQMYMADSEVSFGYVTFLKSHVAIVPNHYVTKFTFEAGEDPALLTKLLLFRSSHGNSAIDFTISIEEFLFGANFDATFEDLPFENNDLALIAFPRRVRPHKDIMKFIPTASDYASLKSKNIVLVFPNAIAPLEQHTTEASYMQNEYSYKGIVKEDPDDFITLNKYFRYQASTSYGSCGALIFVLDKHMSTAKFFGIHVAGDTKVGFGSCLVREWIQAQLHTISSEQQITDDIVPQTWNHPVSNVGDGRFISLYDVPKDESVNTFWKTKIVKSQYYGCWGPSGQSPAKLSPFYSNGALVDPMYNAVNKYCTPHVHIDQRLVDKVAISLFDSLKRRSKIDVQPRIFSFSEAVKGLENEPYYSSILRGSSPGYPYSIQSRVKPPGKKYYFFGSDDFDLQRDAAIEINEEVERVLDLCSKNIRPLFLFTDFPKDERRDNNKVINGSTRLVSAGNLVLLLAYRRMFGAFQLWTMKNKIDNGSAVGADCHGLDWHDIAMHLLQKGNSRDKCVGAGDYSKFDGSEKSIIHWAILDVINKWYGDDPRNQLIRSILWLEVTNSRHIYGSVVYQWVSSLPSGHPLTTIINNLYNQMAFRLCWLRLHEDDISSLPTFDDNVYLITMGDDNLFSVSTPYRNKFHEYFLSETMQTFGLTYTSETKGEASASLRRLDEVEFEKRTFRFDNILGRYVAPLRMSVILEMPYWTKDKSDAEEIANDTANTALVELSLHGVELFNKFGKPMIEAMNIHGFHPFSTDYEICLLRTSHLEY